MTCSLTSSTGITDECKCALANFVSEGSLSSRAQRGWLICLLSSPPVIVAATASGEDAASDVQLLRASLPIGLVIGGCWQLQDGSNSLAICAKLWKEGGAAGAGVHFGVSAAGELTTAVPVVPRPESLLLNISFSLAVAKGCCCCSCCCFYVTICVLLESCALRCNLSCHLTSNVIVSLHNCSRSRGSPCRFSLRSQL